MAFKPIFPHRCGVGSATADRELSSTRPRPRLGARAAAATQGHYLSVFLVFSMRDNSHLSVCVAPAAWPTAGALSDMKCLLLRICAL
jgi:hypothetical protein